MTMVWLTIYVLASLLLGAGLLALAQRPFANQTSLSPGPVLLLGVGGVGWLTMMLRLAGIPPGRWSIVAAAVVALVGTLPALRHHLLLIRPAQSDPERAEWRRPALWVPVAVLAAVHAIVIVHALGFPMHEWDAFAIWGLKAKILAHAANLPIEEALTDVSLSFSRLDYPLLVPGMMAAVYDLLGSVDDRWAQLCMPMLFLGLSLTLAGFCRRRMPLARALAVTALVVAAPVVVRWAGAGNADLPLAAFHALAVVSMVEWHSSGDRSWCIIAGLAAAFAALSKQEGVPLALALILVLAVLACTKHRPTEKALLPPILAAAVVAVLVLPWLAWAQILPHNHENCLAHLTPSQCLQNLPRLPAIAKAFLIQAVDPRRSGPVWIVLALVAILRRDRGRNPAVLSLWALLTIQSGLYALVFLITPWNLQEQLAVTLDRLTIHAIPLGGVLIALYLADEPSPADGSCRPSEAAAGPSAPSPQ